jgi:hypothetical protein
MAPVLPKDVVLPLIPNADKILCVGLNYATHVAETGREQKEHPAIFQRWNDTLIADGQPMVRPPESIRFDYEGELAVIIGKPGAASRRKTPGIMSRAMRPSTTARCATGSATTSSSAGQDLARHRRLRPALVTPDEIEDLGAIRVQTRLNGELVQDQPVRHDLGYPHGHRLLLDLHPAQPRRRDRHRHAGRCRRQAQAPST